MQPRYYNPHPHTTINTQPLYRCTPNSPVLSLVLKGIGTQDDIVLSNGTWGAHIPSNVAVNVTIVPDQKLLFTLKNYGSYLCDNTVANRGTIGTEHGVTDEFQAAYGYPFNAIPKGSSTAWYNNLITPFQSLQVVINNHKNSMGGGGTLLQPPPSPICPL